MVSEFLSAIRQRKDLQEFWFKRQLCKFVPEPDSKLSQVFINGGARWGYKFIHQKSVEVLNLNIFDNFLNFKGFSEFKIVKDFLKIFKHF